MGITAINRIISTFGIISNHVQNIEQKEYLKENIVRQIKDVNFDINRIIIEKTVDLIFLSYNLKRNNNHENKK